MKNVGVVSSSVQDDYEGLKQFAREMRATPTLAEDLLWECLRNKKLGVKFRRQHVLGPFIVDFFSISAQLIIEVDGSIHKEQKEKDIQRSAILEARGLKIIRISNHQILFEIDNVISLITTEINRPK